MADPSRVRVPADCGRRVLLVRAIEEAYRPIYANTVCLSLLWVSAGIRAYCRDVETHLLDWNDLAPPTKKQGLQWLDHVDETRAQRFRECLATQQPTIVAISAYSCFMPVALQIARLVRQWDPRVPVILGGFHATAYPESIGTYDDFDYYVRGEGVRVGPQLINALLDGSPALADIPSLALRDATGAVITTPLEELPELDENPVIDWSDVDHDAYQRDRLFQVVDEYYLEFPRGKLVVYEASQGCRYKCAFCEQRVQHGNRARHFSPARILDDLRRIKDAFDCGGVFFTDEYIHYDRPWFDELLAELSRHDLGLEYTMAVKADEIDEEIVDRIVDAGFVQLSSYPESGSPRILEAMHKAIDLDEHLRVMEYASDQGLLCFTGLVLGWPGETRAEAEQSLALAEREFADFVHTQPVAYLARSELASYLPKLGIEADTPAYFRMLNTSADHCLADYSKAELRYFVDGRNHTMNRAKIESARTRAKLERLGWKLRTIEEQPAALVPAQPVEVDTVPEPDAEPADERGDIADVVGASIEKHLLPDLEHDSYRIAAHSLHPAEEEFDGSIIVKLTLRDDDTEIGIHVYPKMDRPCFQQTAAFNVCYDGRGDATMRQQALLLAFIERLCAWEEREDVAARELLAMLRSPSALSPPA